LLGSDANTHAAVATPVGCMWPSVAPELARDHLRAERLGRAGEPDCCVSRLDAIVRDDTREAADDLRLRR
jgi:hypothetical protein